MSTGTSRKLLDKPADETIQRIDFVIQGLENGQFKDLAKKVDFHQKLKGEDAKRFIGSLIDTIEEQQQEINSLYSDTSMLREELRQVRDKVEHQETMLVDYMRNMRGIANGLLILAKPDPFDQDYTTAPNKHDAEQFVNDYKAKY